MKKYLYYIMPGDPISFTIHRPGDTPWTNKSIELTDEEFNDLKRTEDNWNRWQERLAEAYDW